MQKMPMLANVKGAVKDGLTDCPALLRLSESKSPRRVVAYYEKSEEIFKILFG